MMASPSMAAPTTLTVWLFIGLTALMAVFFAGWLVRAERGHGTPAGRAIVLLLFLGAYLVAPAILSATGQLSRYTPLPTLGAAFLALITPGTIAIAASPLGARLATALSLPVLIGYQVFRLPLEVLLHRLFLEKAIPVQMTYSGWNFDILTGLSAAALGLYYWRRSRPLPWLTLAWNLFGLALLINIVVIAALSTPSFEVFDTGPQNLLPSTFPFVWLPYFLVQLALLGHLLTFRRISGRIHDG
jgi:hypothetical protein